MRKKVIEIDAGCGNCLHGLLCRVESASRSSYRIVCQRVHDAVNDVDYCDGWKWDRVSVDPKRNIPADVLETDK